MPAEPVTTKKKNADGDKKSAYGMHEAVNHRVAHVPT